MRYHRIPVRSIVRFCGKVLSAILEPAYDGTGWG